ncbi:hypothetical protein D3C81_1956430 [compost metagenome]
MHQPHGKGPAHKTGAACTGDEHLAGAQQQPRHLLGLCGSKLRDRPLQLIHNFLRIADGIHKRLRPG